MSLPPPSADKPQPVPWPVFPAQDDIVFHGYAPEAGAALITVETPTGDVLGVLHHHVRHSPNGFQWGYTGSGPAETARCLLLAALPDIRCPLCLGTGKTMLEGIGSEENPLTWRPFNPETDNPDSELLSTCGYCDDGLAPVPYQDFKFEVVAGWGREWRMPRTEIVSWLQRHKATHEPDAHDNES